MLSVSCLSFISFVVSDLYYLVVFLLVRNTLPVAVDVGEISLYIVRRLEKVTFKLYVLCGNDDINGTLRIEVRAVTVYQSLGVEKPSVSHCRVHDKLGERIEDDAGKVFEPSVIDNFVFASETAAVDTVHTLGHGVPLPIYDELKQKKLVIQDATCPFVSKIHSIVTNASQKGDIILIAGNSEHPEVLGIKSRCSNAAYTFRDDVELSDLLKNHPELKETSVSVVAQTTFNTEIWKKCLEIFKKDCTNATLFDTICSATQSRQQEAAELSEKCDLMIVIGGTNSSNTAKLFHICSDHCRSVLIQTASDLPVNEVKAASNIGVTAGASTPADIITEVLSALSSIQGGTDAE